MRFISHDFDHKMWNYSNQFDRHILPDKNYAVQLSKQRFNGLVLASAICIHHEENVRTFLDKYENVTNSLACIIRYVIFLFNYNIIIDFFVSLIL